VNNVTEAQNLIVSLHNNNNIQLLGSNIRKLCMMLPRFKIQLNLCETRIILNFIGSEILNIIKPYPTSTIFIKK